MIQKNMQNLKISISIGFALFAMLFGAGNIIFPLYLGANIGEHVIISITGFLITGVGAPFLGLISSGLFKGNYMLFFEKLGKIPAIIIISFLMIIIGPLIAIPRTETIVFSNLNQYLPNIMKNNIIFSFIYCTILIFISMKESKIIDILGYILSPLKILTFSSLIIIGLFFAKQIEINESNNITSMKALEKSIITGYSTMDLLATFFFSTIAFKTIENIKKNVLIIINASIIGSLLIGLIYVGFILLSYKYKNILVNIPIESTLIFISKEILGEFGGIFICLCLSLACLATALALTQASKLYLYNEIFKKKISKTICLLIIITITYIMSHLKFQKIMNLITPILEIIYPSLIILCVANIIYKIKKIDIIKISVYTTIILSIIVNITHIKIFTFI